MTDWIALSRNAHREQGYAPRNAYHHAAGQMSAPVVLAELVKVMPHYLIGFLPLEAGMMPVAVLGVEQDQNLYLHPDGRWLARYVPAALRGFPFALADGSNGEKVLSIASDHLGSGDEPLFEGGKPAEPVSQTMDFLRQYETNRQATLSAGQVLEQAGLLIPWPLTLPLGGSHHRVDGLYRVDEEALNALEAERYVGLQGAPMSLAYAQLYSIEQVNQLTHRAHLQSRLGPARKPDLDLDDLFGDDDDDLSFNF